MLEVFVWFVGGIRWRCGVSSVSEVDLPFVRFDCWLEFGMWVGFGCVVLGLNFGS